MRAKSTLSLFLLVFCVSFPYFSQAHGIYCVKGTAHLDLGSSHGAEGDVSSVYKYCKVGDILPIPENDTAVIAQVCNFSKSIVAGPGGQVICVIAPKRPIGPS